MVVLLKFNPIANVKNRFAFLSKQKHSGLKRFQYNLVIPLSMNIMPLTAVLPINCPIKIP